MIERLGKYEIQEEIATSDRGTVYRALDTVSNRVVAIRVIDQSLANDPQYLQSLEERVQLAGLLDHPNIATIHDFGVEDGITYLAMEYVPDSVAIQLASGRHFSWRRSVEIALQVCRALQHAHEQGVVHRNIKPQNILLRADGTVSITDIGSAGALGSPAGMSTGNEIEASRYMSSEQWDSGQADSRSDIYALGISLYEMLAGSPPFQGNTTEEIRAQHTGAPMPPFPEVSRVPAIVAAVVERAMEKDPESRYASADAMTTALDDLLSGKAFDPPEFIAARSRLASRASGPPKKPPSGLNHGRRFSGGLPRRYLFFGAGVAAIVAIAVVAAVFALGTGDDGDGDGLAVAPTPRPADTVAAIQAPTPGSIIDSTITPALPTPTIAPTDSPVTVPSNTAEPATKIPESTGTPAPTSTPAPTFTPRPTPTPGFLDSYNRGITFLNAENYTLAIDEFTAAISLAPAHVDSYSNRALAYSKSNQWKLAVDDYARAIDLDSDEPRYHKDRADNLVLLKLDRLAIDEYLQAISLDPSFPGAFRGMGSAYQRFEEYPEALEAFGQALRYDQVDQDSLRRQAWINNKVGLYQSSVEIYSTLLNLSSTNVDHHYGRALAHHNSNLFENALIDIENAISIKDLVAEYYYLRSLIHTGLGNTELASADLGTSCILSTTLLAFLPDTSPPRICP